MNFKKLTLTRLALFFLFIIPLIFPTKNIFAADNCYCNGGSGDSAYTCTMSGGTWKCGESRISGKLAIPQQIKKEAIDKQEALKDDNVNSENWIKSSAITNGLLGINILAGTDTQAMVSADASWTPGGFIGITNNVIASLYTPPISGTEYIANSINNFLGKPAYARTGGAFNGLSGILPLWRTCRNAVYVLISIVFVVIGLLIMLRIKISPQATITIQNSIPKIIITLILVTFSYAIIGLIIDLTYLIQALVLSLLVQNNSNPKLLTNIPELSKLMEANSGTYSYLMFKAMLSSANTIANIVLSLFGGLGVALMAGLGLAGGWIAGLIGFVLGAFIILVFLFIQLIKFLFGCAKAYILLLIKIISAPFEIALGAFPNSKIGFGSWFMQTLAYASVFPISLIFLVLLVIIVNAVNFTNLWTPGVIEGSMISSFLGSILAISGLSVLAKLPDIIPEAIFQIKPSPLGKEAGNNIFVGGGRAAASGVAFKLGQGVADVPTRMAGPATALYRAHRAKTLNEPVDDKLSAQGVQTTNNKRQQTDSTQAGARRDRSTDPGEDV
jgi:hypothetical protein